MRFLGIEVTRAGKSSEKSVPTSYGTMLGLVREPYAGAWQEGASQANPMGAVTTYGAVFACISRIASDIAKLEPRLMQQLDGVNVRVTDASPYWRPLKRPNGFQNRIQWMSWWMTSKLLYGNAYQLKRRDERGMVVELIALDSRQVTPLVTPDGDVYYQIGANDLAQTNGATVPASEVIHDRGTTLWHPLVGVSPIYACGMSATQGTKIQGNSSVFFANMSRPSGMLTSPQTIDDVTALRLKSEWEKNYQGGNLGRLAVLGDGLKYEPMTIPAEQAQLIEQLNWTVEDVARSFAVPLYKINSGPMPTSNNVEALETQYYTGCLQPQMEAIELALTEGLALPASYSVQFDLDGLLRMDGASQADMLTKEVLGGIRKPNEARRARNLPPVEGGDAVYLQQQNYSLEALARRDAKEDPFSSGASSGSSSGPPASDSPGDQPPEDGPQAAQDGPGGDSEDAVQESLAAAFVERMKALPLLEVQLEVQANGY